MSERAPTPSGPDVQRRPDDPTVRAGISTWKVLVGILAGAVSGAGNLGCESRGPEPAFDASSGPEKQLLQAFGEVDILADPSSIKISGDSPIATKILIRLIYWDGINVSVEEEFAVGPGPFEVSKKFKITPPGSRVEIQDSEGVIRSMKLPSSSDPVPDEIPYPG